MARVVQAIAAMFMLSACLVTDEISFPEEPEFPPTIVDVPGTEIPIGSIFWIDLDGHAQNEWELPVRIRDDNIDQVLEARYRVVKAGEVPSRWHDDEIAVSGTADREDYSVRILFTDVAPGECHVVELVVSGAFVKRSRQSAEWFDEPVDEADLARASWTIWEGKGDRDTLADAKAVLIDSCKAIESLLRATESVESEGAP